MNLSEVELLEVCRRRIIATVTQDQLAQTGFSALQMAREVAKIVRRNLASGRVRSIEHLQLEGYVDAVIRIYLTEHHRVEQLAERNDEKWVRLHALLIRRAFGILQRSPAAGQRLKDEAADFAQQACVSIFSAIFPYDVPFEAWATVILANHIRQRHMRSRDLIDRTPAIESLDQPKDGGPDDTTSPYETLIDPTAGDLFERWDLQRHIVDAIGQLSSQAQQNVVICSYFYDWSDEQLAESMGKTKQAIYNLRHRALHQLRQILSEDTDPVLLDPSGKSGYGTQNAKRTDLHGS